MRDGVLQILLKLFVGALDQQLRVMSLPNKGRDRSAPGGIPASPIPTRSTTPLRHAKVLQTHVAQNPPQPFDRVLPRAQSASAHAIARSERICRRRPSRMTSKMTCGSPSNNDAMIR